MKFERISKEQAKEKIKELVNNFESQKDYYLDPSYNETMVRNDFIDKFFMALGWDVNDDSAKGNNREVIKEFNSKQEDSIKHPDYAFTFNREVKFFVEAKKPSIDLKNNSAYAIQIRKYGYTKKLKISILTDFEEFVVYDTTKKPRIKDSAKNCKIDYLKYTQYVDKFDELWDHFSWEAVYSTDGFETYIRNLKIRRTEEVDKDLLNTIEKWREKLAQNLALRNNEINKNKLNIAVQKIIDRLLFLRIAEDREMEEENSIRQVIGYNNRNIYKELLKKFDEADKKYNSGLFKNIGWFNKLNIDCKVIQEIIEDMYPPKCFYQWNVLPIEILGNIYEQFLGSEIVLKNINLERHTAKIVMKPETKKAGGVFYTPQYIVDYIVRETLGNKLKNLTTEQASKIKILDPACGSGSFLIGAFKYLMDWYYEKYTKTKKMMNDNIYKGILVETNHGLVLSIDEKRKILKNNIFGVDIDSQAVEVAKLSLYLQLFANHGYNKNLLDRLEQLQNAKLPDLSDNIKCGNSVVDNSIYSAQEYTERDKERINAFDWKLQFSEIMKKGGFDIILGNPPYIKEKISKEIFEPLKSNECYLGKMDFWYFFGAKALELLKNNGLVSFIATGNWNSSDGAKNFRNIILSKGKILNYIDFSDYMVFEGASIQTMIFVIEKNNIDKYRFLYYKIKDSKSNEEVRDLLKDYKNAKIKKVVEIDRNKLINNIIPFVDIETNDSRILDKIKKKGDVYLDTSDITEGIVPAPDKYFIIKDISKFKKNELVFIKKWHTGLKSRYQKSETNEYIIYLSKQNFEDENINEYPNINKHFNQFKKELKQTKIKYGAPNLKYYYVNRPRDVKYFIDGNEKVVIQIRCLRPTCYYTKEEFYGSRALYYIQTLKVNMKYLTALLNSNLIFYWIKHFGKFQGNTIKMESEPLKNIPIANTTDKNIENIGQLVDKITLLKSKEKSAIINNEIKYLEKSIDDIIYKIYCLTNKEIEIIERYINANNSFS